MKRIAAYTACVFLLLTALSGCASDEAEKPDGFTAQLLPKIDAIFGSEKEQYTVFDNQMQDVTANFIARNTDNYAEGKVQAIADDIRENIMRIEKAAEQPTQAQQSGQKAVHIRCEFTQKMEALDREENL